ncbi:hypothetical protein [Aromatoleum petrolei]|uniref:hypothetical protein n=1 Tax=Aromatoleum petrolei TaxID=76116 RepID=UPI00145D0279|nr:hypothetical protein [Aromatoleum petrolei]
MRAIIIVLIAMQSFVIGSVNADQGVAGGLAALSTCVNECVAPGSYEFKPTERECLQVCECWLTIESSRWREEMTDASRKLRGQVCAAKVWPQHFAALASIKNHDHVRPRKDVIKYGRFLGDESQVERSQRDVVRTQIQTLMASNQKILGCHYSEPEFSKTYYLWYEKVPIRQSDLFVASERHPLRFFGDVAFVECPKNLGEMERYAKESIAAWRRLAGK